jgi:endonuclease/exonuclease/phosphatase family metal-dependent hydrolase
MPDHRGILVRALTWNLFHGRDFPPDPSLRGLRSRLRLGRSLLEQFAWVLGDLEWDLALLQEAPPRWQTELARRTGSSSAIALTSRNLLPRVRAALAELSPNLMASGEGGSNQLLVRAPGRILEVRRLTLTRRPERRRMLWALVELAGGGRLAVANLHATAHDPAAAARELELAAERAVEWAGEHPLLLGGDLNLRPREDTAAFARLRERFGLGPPTAPDSIDHLLARGLEVRDPPAALPPAARELEEPEGLLIRLSDHAPVAATLGMK